MNKLMCTYSMAYLCLIGILLLNLYFMEQSVGFLAGIGKVTNRGSPDPEI